MTKSSSVVDGVLVQSPLGSTFISKSLSALSLQYAYSREEKAYSVVAILVDQGRRVELVVGLEETAQGASKTCDQILVDWRKALR